MGNLNLDPLRAIIFIVDNLGYVFIAFFLALASGYYLGLYFDYLDHLDPRETNGDYHDPH